MPSPDTIFTLHLSCSIGLEQLLAEEATTLGALDARPRLGRVTCQGDLTTAYKLILWSRLANRVLLQLDTAKIEDATDLNDWLSQMDWSQHLAPEGSLFVEVSGTTPKLRNTHDTALRVKDAVVDYFSAKFGCRPSVEKYRPDLRLHLRFEKFQTCVLSLDLGGQSLHQRNYRLEAGKAPLKENLAAGLLLRAGWPELAAQGASLFDPFCGSGTLLIEAALMALDIAPGLLRPWHGLENWPRHQPEIWQTLLAEAQERQTAAQERTLTISGSDKDPQAIQTANNNLERAGLKGRIRLTTRTVQHMPAAATNQGLIITNPPYGERLDNLPRLASLYTEFGQLVARNYPKWHLALFTNNPNLSFRLGLKSHKNYPFQNGSLDCRLYLFNVPELSPNKETASPAQQVNALSSGAQMLANRLKKNLRNLAKWVKQEEIQAYRLYDADMPEYAFAIDIYNNQVHVQEYAPPAKVDPNQAQKRFMEALQAIPAALDLPPESLHLKTRRRQAGKKQYEKQDQKNKFFAVQEGPIKALVNLDDYLDTGLFLDHRPIRRRLGQESRGKRFLNLFCYTGVATLHAAAGKAAQTTSVDLSKTYLSWLEKNLHLNKFQPKRNQIIQADCLKWLAQDNNSYDLIFMDPPTFSNSKQMQGTLDIQRDHNHLIHLAMRRLAPQGSLYFSTNLRGFKIDPSLAEQFALEDISASTLDPDFQRNQKIHQCFKIQHLSA